MVYLVVDDDDDFFGEPNNAEVGDTQQSGADYMGTIHTDY